jgi:hypothetical protein
VPDVVRKLVEIGCSGASEAAERHQFQHLTGSGTLPTAHSCAGRCAVLFVVCFAIGPVRLTYATADPLDVAMYVRT